MNYYVGIDLGGTFIKSGLVGEDGKIIRFERIPTRASLGAHAVLDDIDMLIGRLSEGVEGGVKGVGIGIPGLTDEENKSALVAPNLKWKNVPVADELIKKYSCPVRLLNDANAAGLGEARFGSAMNYKTSVLLTLGTGVGGAIVIDGKLYEGNKCAGGEIGHMIIRAGGRKCNCGNFGCYETYASATALIRNTVEAMEKHPESKLWEVGGTDKVNGKTAFDYYGVDKTAERVVDDYVDDLTIGIINIANILRPEAVVLGGGVAKQGKVLTDMVERRLDSGVFAASVTPKVKILTASLEEAGVVGAASYVMPPKSV